MANGTGSKKNSINKLEKKIGNIDGPLGEEWQAHIADHLPANIGFQKALGTIGGGNHFAELQCFDEIHDVDAFQALAHGAGQKWMRSECKGPLSKRYAVKQLSRTKLGSHIIFADRKLIYEDAPT
jgi:RNA-splicing ligase RtcB